MQSGRSFNIFIGINKESNSNGLTGSIRQIVVQTKYLEQIQEVKETAFHLIEGADVKIHMVLNNSTEGLRDYVSGRQGRIVGKQYRPEDNVKP